MYSVAQISKKNSKKLNELNIRVHNIISRWVYQSQELYVIYYTFFYCLNRGLNGFLLPSHQGIMTAQILFIFIVINIQSTDIHDIL